MEALLRGLEKLARRFGDRAVCVESPPPLGDDDDVREYLDEHFRKDFADGRDIVKAGVTLPTGCKAWFGSRRWLWPNYEASFLRARRELHLVQTDLACINRRHVDEFIAALQRL